jgi:YihY family inner membrane protein
MASASAVPETYDLQGDDAKQTLKRVGWGRLLKDSFTRFRSADGFTNARAIGHAAVLTAIPGLIAVVGIATALDAHGFRQVLRSTIQHFAPGQSGRLLQEAFRQGAHGGVAIVGGLLGVLISGTFAMAVVERSGNRVYGMIRDRSIVKKILVGFGLNVSAGILLALGFVLLAAGGGIGAGLTRAGASDVWATVFAFARWPLGLLTVFAALTLVYKISPNRHQPGAAWLQTGTVMATILWVALTALLAWYYGSNSTLGNTYGPLVGIIALLTWAYATGVAIVFGLAFAAELEAIRAGVRGPRTYRRFNETVVDPAETKHLEYERPAVVSRPAAPTVEQPAVAPAAATVGAPAAPDQEPPPEEIRRSA